MRENCIPTLFIYLFPHHHPYQMCFQIHKNLNAFIKLVISRSAAEMSKPVRREL
jgi:hypothetical protein